MVTIKNYQLHSNASGENYISLELIGDIEFLQSKKTGRFYATAKRCFISSTFDEITAQLMVGRSITGSIVKKECDAYNFTIPETGEAISITHRYEYLP